MYQSHKKEHRKLECDRLMDWQTHMKPRVPSRFADVVTKNQKEHVPICIVEKCFSLRYSCCILSSESTTTTGRWFSPVSSTNKTGRHDITEILLKVALNTITILTPNPPKSTIVEKGSSKVDLPILNIIIYLKPYHFYPGMFVSPIYVN